MGRVSSREMGACSSGVLLISSRLVRLGHANGTLTLAIPPDVQREALTGNHDAAVRSDSRSNAEVE